MLILKLDVLKMLSLLLQPFVVLNALFCLISVLSMFLP